ncbi:hypothetical protein EON65_36165, partial [archaeon]
MTKISLIPSFSSPINSLETPGYVEEQERLLNFSPARQNSPELPSSPNSRTRSFRTQKLPSIEDAIEIVVDKEDVDYGRARVRTRNSLLQDNPGIYYSGGLDSDDYHWILEDGFYEGRSHRPFEDMEFEPTLFPIVD